MVIHQQEIELVDFKYGPTWKSGFVNTDNEITSITNQWGVETIWQPTRNDAKRAAWSGKLSL